MPKGQPKTIFCDIDGVIFKHFSCVSGIYFDDPELLPGVLDKFDEWNRKGYRVILTTGRMESMREITIRQITEAGLYYHELIMNLPRGSRVVINDSKANSDACTAFAFSIKRDEGLGNVDV